MAAVPPTLRMRFSLALVCIAFLLVVARTAGAAGDGRNVRHPNLLLNRDEIEQVKAKVREQPWAARLLDRVRSMADDDRHTEREPRDAALAYALTSEKRYADAARRAMLGRTAAELPKYENLDIKAQPELGAYGPWAQWAWAYDLTYDTFSPDERQRVEEMLRTAARTIIAGCKVGPTTMGLVFEKHWKVALIGYCLGDRELIEWGLHDPGDFGAYLGGVYTVLDANVRDELFWAETPHYGMGTVLHGFLAVAEAALHYDGRDLYHYRSPKSGGSIKGLLDGYLRITYPLEKTGIKAGSLRLVTFGDGSTGYTPTGQQTDTYLINPVAGGPKRPTTLNAEFEIAYKRYRDPGYAWVASLNPERDGYIGGDRSVWGFAALTHGEPLPEHPQPPPAASGDYPSQGLVVLRADESPACWNGEAPMAALRLGSAVGHGHNDYFHLLLHGKGRLLYPTIQLIQYEPNYLGWTREGVACNTLLVDGQSPHPGPVTTRQDFQRAAKFFAVTGSAFEGVGQTRALLLTNEYVADVFRAADERGRPHTYDWLLHGLGRLYPGNPAAWRPTHELVPNYWWVEHERGRTTAETWQADWVQHSAGVLPGAQAFGQEWFRGTAGVRVTMLGHEGTEVYCGDGPIVDAPPYALLDGDAEGSVPMIVARRRATGAAGATFAAVHEPYGRRPSLRRVFPVQESEQAIGIGIDGDGYSDRVLVGFSADRQTHLAGSGESFTFRDHAYLRVRGDQVVASGPITAFRIRLLPGDGAANAIRLTVNGKSEQPRVDGGYLTFGEPGESPALQPPTSQPAASAAEQAAAIHHSFLPAEVHLKAGGAGQAMMYLRCVGATPAGGMTGSLRLETPAGLSVEPASVDVTGMNEGDERDVPLKVSAAEGLAGGAYSVSVRPAGGATAASGELAELPVTVGVVAMTDRRLPMLAQTLVRAPGYTIRIDHRSGTAYYLLDGDGHRRHGHLGDSGTGFFAVARAENKDYPGDSHGRWAFNYRLPCRFVFDATNDGHPSLILVAGGQDAQVRLRYTFYEDRIVATLIQPTDPHAEFEMWLGNFDALGEARLNPSGTERKGKETAIISDGAFFAHPLYRQGLLIGLPEPRPICLGTESIHFSIHIGQDVALRFAEPAEAPPSLKVADKSDKVNQLNKPDKGNKSGKGDRGGGKSPKLPVKKTEH